MSERARMPEYTSTAFQNARRALLACSDADRAYLRRWLLRWTDEVGHIVKDAPKLPDVGVDDYGSGTKGT